MAALTDQSRAELWAEFMRRNDEDTAATKDDARALIDAADDFISANAAAFNQSIPEPARSLFSASQKAFAFELVAERRFGDKV